MTKSKYKNFFYWEHKLAEGEDLFSGIFENKQIMEGSILLDSTILNSYSNQAESAWSVYPNIYSVLGFLQYVYLPTAFIGLVELKETESDSFIDDNLLSVLDDLSHSYPEKASLINEMKSIYTDLETWWECEEGILTNRLKELGVTLQDRLDMQKDNSHMVVSFNLFLTPREAADYVVNVYEEDLSKDMFEQDFDISTEDFLSLSDQVYDNDFTNKKFTDILTNRVSFSS